MIKKRQSNIELLRIAIMFMVVVLHFVGHNVLSSDQTFHLADKNWVSANILESICVCAVDCFILISGYFTIKYSLRKVVLFLLPIAFYEFMLSIIFYNHYHTVSLTPFNYWFVRQYFLLMLIAPFLNAGLSALGKVRTAYLCIVCIILSYCKTPMSDGAGKTFQVFILLYAIGYYLGHYMEYDLPKKVWLSMFVVSTALIFIETLVLDLIGRYSGVRSVSYDYNSIFVILSAISLLMYFSKLSFKSRFINWVGSSTFFVYIISENQNMFMPPYGMYDILNVREWHSYLGYPLLIVSASVCVFVTCILIDKLRLSMGGVKIQNLVGKLCDDVENRIINYLTIKL